MYVCMYLHVLTHGIPQVSSAAGNAQVNSIFDDMQGGAHGANNHHLHKVAKHTPKDP